MEAGWLARARWRRRGAWMWPAFLALTLLDAVVGNLLPTSGGSEDIVAAALVATFANLIGIVVLSWPVSLALRRRRPDLPRIVARDYGGTIVLCAISGVILLAGVVHHATLMKDRRTEREAIARAQAWIGDRAPPAFRRNAEFVDSYAIQPGSIYRECVPEAHGHRTYCVVVRTDLPFGRSVKFAGYESNYSFSLGTR